MKIKFHMPREHEALVAQTPDTLEITPRIFEHQVFGYTRLLMVDVVGNEGKREYELQIGPLAGTLRLKEIKEASDTEAATPAETGAA